jgi:hypothetical protein
MKFYVRLSDATWTHGIDQVVTSFLADHGVAASTYSLNFRDHASWNSVRVREKLTVLPLSDFEYLSVDDAAARQGVAVLGLFRSYRLNDIYELMFKLSQTVNHASVFERQARSLAAAVPQVFYGYGRVLEATVDADSENRIKKTIFGGTSTKVDRMEDTWMEDPSLICQGAMKGIYPLNVVTNLKLNEPSMSDVFQGGRSRAVPGAELTIVEYEPKALSQLRRSSKSLAKFVRD